MIRVIFGTNIIIEYPDANALCPADGGGISIIRTSDDEGLVSLISPMIGATVFAFIPAGVQCVIDHGNGTLANKPLSQ